MNNIKKIAALVLACAAISYNSPSTASAYTNKPEIPLSGTQNRSDNFNKDFTLTGNYADDLVTVAQTQLGLTTEEADYSEDWCANFVADCARLTEMPESIIPYNYSLVAGCRFFYSYLLEYCNATVITDENDVMSGDLVFYYCPESDFYLHVAIVENSYYYLEGNITTAKEREEVVRSNFGYDFGCYMHDDNNDTTESGHVLRFYVRPDYGNPPVRYYTDPDPINYYPPKRILSLNEPITSCGFDVCWVQCILKRVGYTDSVNGIYDEQTREAVKKYQYDNNINPDGITGQETINSLIDLYKDIYLPKLYSFSTAQKSYYLNKKISFGATGSNYDNIQIVITNKDKTIVYSDSNYTPDVPIPAKYIGKGVFNASCTMCNKYGNSITNTVKFTVTDPPPETPEISSSMNSSAPVTFSWNKTKYTDAYDLIINDADGMICTEINNITGFEHTILLSAGEYSAYLIAKNETLSTQSNIINFTAETPPYAVTDDDFYAEIYFDDLCLKAANSMKLADKGSLSSQKWHFVKNSDNTYTIISCKNNKAISIGNNSTVTLMPKAETVLQKWIPVCTNNRYLLVSALDNSKVLSFENGEVEFRKSKDCTQEAVFINTIDTPHRFILTNIEVSKNNIMHAFYTCEITGDTKAAVIPCQTPDSPDMPNTPDTPDSVSRLIGDVNCDGKISNIDSLLILRSVIGLYKLDEISYILHDTNSDGKISSVDSLRILQHVIGIENDSSVGKQVIIR